MAGVISFPTTKTNNNNNCDSSKNNKNSNSYPNSNSNYHHNYLQQHQHNHIIDETNNTIIDYSTKSKKNSEYDHNIVTIISDNNHKQKVCSSYERQSQVHNSGHQNQDSINNNEFNPSLNYDISNMSESNNANNNTNIYNYMNGTTIRGSYGQQYNNINSSNINNYNFKLNATETDLISLTSSFQQQLDEPPKERHINSLFPELLTNIFLFLDTKDKGRVAQVCKYWHEISYEKCIWRGIEAKVHLKSKGNSTLYQSLTRRGIHQIQILSLKKSLRELFVGLPNLSSLKLCGCYNVTDWTLFSTFTSNNHSNNSSSIIVPIFNHESHQSSSSTDYHLHNQSSSSSSRTRLYSHSTTIIQYHHHHPQQLESLSTLDLSLCKQVSDISLGRIAIRASNLKILELGGCCQITDRGLLIIAWGFKKLSKLNLRSCHLVSDIGIGYLSGLVTIEHLHEPKTFDFLTKFGLLQLNGNTTTTSNYDDEKNLVSNNSNNDLNLNQSLKNRNASNPSHHSIIFEYNEPIKAKRSRSSHNTNSRDDESNRRNIRPSSSSRHQQCSLCHQLIVPSKSSFSSTRGGFEPSMNETIIQNYSSNYPQQYYNSSSSSRKRKFVCKKYLMNTTFDNSQRIINGNGSSSTNLNFSSRNSNSSSSNNIIIVGFEKIGPNTVFGTKCLESLVLQDCQKLTDTCLSYISPPPPNDNNNTSNSSFSSSSSTNTRETSSSLSSSNTSGLLALKSINLSFCIHITDTGLKQLAKLPKLQDINLRSCDSITDYGLGNLKECGSRLISLDISFCDKINNSGLNHIANWMNGLVSLSISSCNISDSGLLRIASNLPKLETLHLGQCSKVTDESIKIIAEKCRNIKYIDLYGCNKISREGLEILLRLPNIVSLNLGLWHLR